jgi:hypothetical protein
VIFSQNIVDWQQVFGGKVGKRMRDVYIDINALGIAVGIFIIAILFIAKFDKGGG